MARTIQSLIVPAVSSWCFVGLRYSYLTAHCHIYPLRFILTVKKHAPIFPLPNTETYLFTEEVWVTETDGKATGTCACMCACGCTVLTCVRVHRCYVCLWKGNVSPSALALPQTRLLLTSVSQLADWRENIPAPSLSPSLPLHTSLPPPNNSNQPASQPVR